MMENESKQQVLESVNRNNPIGRIDTLIKRLCMGLDEAVVTREVSPRIKALVEETVPELSQEWLNYKWLWAKTLTTEELNQAIEWVQQAELLKVIESHFPCPQCLKEMNHYRNTGRDHWGVCLDCHITWFIGSNLFSSYREETEAMWEENKAYLSQFRVVGDEPSPDHLFEASF